MDLQERSLEATESNLQGQTREDLRGDARTMTIVNVSSSTVEVASINNGLATAKILLITGKSPMIGTPTMARTMVLLEVTLASEETLPVLHLLKQADLVLPSNKAMATLDLVSMPQQVDNSTATIDLATSPPIVTLASNPSSLCITVPTTKSNVRGWKGNACFSSVNLAPLGKLGSTITTDL